MIGKKFSVAVRRLVLQFHGLHTRAQPGLYVHHDIHLMSGGVRYILGRDLRCIEALFLQDIAEAREPFVHIFLSEWPAQRDLHGSSGRCIRWRWRQSIYQNPIEKKTLSNHEVEPHSTVHESHDRFQIRVITQPVQCAQALRNLLSIQWFPYFNRKAFGRFRKHPPIFGDNPYRNDGCSGRSRLRMSFRLCLSITPRSHQ